MSNKHLLLIIGTILLGIIVLFPRKKITSSFSNTNKSAIVNYQYQNSSIQFETPIDNSKIIKNKDKSTTYTTPNKNIEIKYTPLPNGLKEDIILNKIPTTNTFTSTLKTTNADIYLNGEGLPVFFKPNTKEYLFHVQKPYVYDATGNKSYAITYQIINNPEPKNTTNLLPKLTKLKQNTNYSLAIIIDSKWLFDKSRVYPITIDPTIIHDTSTEFVAGDMSRVKDIGSGFIESAIGGTISYSGGYTIHTFLSGTATFTPSTSGNVEVLVVGGGGGGGSANCNGVTGGGGAGGLIYNKYFSVANSSINVSVGTGGVVDTNGTNSVFSSLIAIGGGAGGGWVGCSAVEVGHTGGSGGGGPSFYGAAYAGGAGTIGQGYAGGTGKNYLVAPTGYASGGGGGAGGPGGNGGASPGTGGLGLYYDISGTITYYANGCGLNSQCNSVYGGGGIGINPDWPNPSQSTGAKGIVIVRYPTVSLQSYYQELPADSATVGLWHLNESAGTTIADSSGNSNTGTLGIGTTSPSLGVTSILDNGINFDGNDYISIGTSLAGIKTVEFWIYPTSLSGGLIQFQSGIGITSNSSGLISAIGFTSPTIYINGVVNTTIYLNTWNHIAITTDTSFTGNSNSLGKFGTVYLAGILDEVRISNVARSAEDIKASASRRPSAVYTSPVIDFGVPVTSWNPLSWTKIGENNNNGEFLSSNLGLIAQWDFNETTGGYASVSAGSCGYLCKGRLSDFAVISGQDLGVTSGWTAINKKWGAGALMFDGVNDNVDSIPSISNIQTIEFWLKPNILNNGIMRLQSGIGISSDTTGLITAVGFTSPTIYVNGVVNSYLSPNVWNYVAVTTSVGITGNAILIGAFASFIYTNGTIDSTRIYNRALSAYEIYNNYQNQLNTTGNIEFQTRTGNSADPNDGSWGSWSPNSSETSILNLDSDASNWSWDNTSTYFPKSNLNDSIIKSEGSGSLKFTTGIGQTDANTVALWHLDETSGNVFDSTSNNNTGTPTGTTVVNGISGKGRSFNGSGNYIDIAAAASVYELTQGTVSLWFKVNDTSVNTTRLFSIAKSGTSFPASDQWTLDYRGGAGQYNVQVSTTQNSATITSALTPINSLNDNSWHHVAVVSDKINPITIYLDGVSQTLNGTTTDNFFFDATTANNMKIGAIQREAIYSEGNKVIDGLKIDNIARSPEEIAEAYRLGRDHYLNRTISSTDLSAKTSLPFYVAADRPGSYLTATAGESPFANYQPDANTIGLWHLDDDGSKSSGEYVTDTSGYPTTQLFTVGGWASNTVCSDTSSHQTGIESTVPSAGNTYGGNTWTASTNASGNFNWDVIICGTDCTSRYAYSHIYIYSPTDQTIRFKWGSDDASRLWVNGVLKFTQATCQGVVVDAYQTDVAINKGWNRVLWAVTEGGGGYGLAYRITDTSNNALRLAYRINTPTDINDSSGNGNHGTNVGSDSTQGKIGKARSFNGSSDYITLSGSPAIQGNNARSISAWIKTTRTTAQAIVATGTANTSQAFNFIISYGTSGYVGVMGYANDFYPSSGTIVTDGNWHYVNAVYDGNGTIKTYVDGNLNATGSYTYSTSGQNNFIGKSNHGANPYYFSGLIDEVRIDNIARTADEIRQAYEIGLRSHPITIDFASSLASGNLVVGSTDYSFTLASAANLYLGDKIIIKENIGGTEFIAQGTVNYVNVSTGAVTISNWDSGGTFPSGGFTINSTVFKWQREYWNITEPTNSDLNTVTNLSLRLTDGNEGRTIWLDDLRSNSNYLSNSIGSTITSAVGGRYFQYRTIFSNYNKFIFPSLTSVTVDYLTNSSPAVPTLITPLNTSTSQIFTPSLSTVTTDGQSNDCQYKIQLCTNYNMNIGCSIFDQSTSQIGWSGQDVGTSAYSSGSTATFTIQNPLSPSATYYWRSYAIDPSGSNTWSSTQAPPFSFTTNSIPNTPALIYPLNFTVNPTLSTYFITRAIDNDNDNLKYKIELATNSNFTGTTQTFDQTVSTTGWSNTIYASGSTAVFIPSSPLNIGTTYYWRSYAIDPSGSNTWSATQSTIYSFNSPSSPLPPSGCVINESENDSSFILRWIDYSPDEDGYEIQKSVDGGAFTTLITGLAIGTTSYTDNTVSSNHTYTYRITPYFSSSSERTWCTTSTLNTATSNLNLD